MRKLHDWNLSPRDAAALQERLRKRIRLRPLRTGAIRNVAGSDIAVSRQLGMLVASLVVLRFPSLEVVEERTARAPLAFPYVPGLLSFREVPALLKVLEQARSDFQVLLCDGQGIAHPRRFGLASHLGLLAGIPTIGCAKSRLIGEHEAPGRDRGSYSPLRIGGRTVGSVLRTRSGVKPIYVSPGHLVDNRSARRIVLACSTRYRIPEPTRRAHMLAEREKRRIEGKVPGGREPGGSGSRPGG